MPPWLQTLAAILSAVATFIHTNRVAALVVTWVLLHSYVTWCERRGKTGGWLYTFFSTVLEVLPYRRGQVVQVRRVDPPGMPPIDPPPRAQPTPPAVEAPNPVPLAGDRP